MLQEIMELMELLDTHKADGSVVAEWLAGVGLEAVEVTRVEGKDGATDFIKAEIRGLDPSGPTLGIIGRLGGVGAFPRKLGLVSDADGAIVALASAAKLAKMRKQGDLLKGHVIVATHICTCSPIIPHEPTPFMGSPHCKPSWFCHNAYGEGRLYPSSKQRSTGHHGSCDERNASSGAYKSAGYHAVWERPVPLEQHPAAFNRYRCSGSRCCNHCLNPCSRMRNGGEPAFLARASGTVLRRGS